MAFDSAALTADLTTVFQTNYDSETASAAAIASAISKYFLTVATPAPGSASAADMTSEATTALAGMSETDPDTGAGLFAEKLSAAVMAAANVISTEGVANSPVTLSAPVYTFSNDDSAAAAAAKITAATDLATATWTQIIPPATATVPWAGA